MRFLSLYNAYNNRRSVISSSAYNYRPLFKPVSFAVSSVMQPVISGLS